MKLHLKENFTKMAEKAEQIRVKYNGTLKKTIIATLVVSTISINSAFSTPASANSSNFQKIYHVYVENEFIGTVSDKNKVEELINNKINQVKEQYKGYEFSFKTDEVSFVSEQMFREADTNDAVVLSELEKEIDVIVDAVALKVDGEVVAYLESKNKVDELLNNLKLQYVSQADLNLLASQQKNGEALPPLSVGGSRILDVTFNKNVTVSLEETEPKNVLKVDTALQLLKKGTLEEEKYVIQSGDVLGSIANRHGLTLNQLLQLNPNYNESSVLQIGDEVNVTVFKPFLDVVVQKEVYNHEEIDYETKVVNDDSMYKGDSKVVQEGSKGTRAINYVVSEVNGIQKNRNVKSEVIVKEPVDRVVHKGTKVIASRGTGSLSWPTNGGYVSSYQGYRWGRFHKGIDIARPSNRTIKAVDNGVVTFAGWDGSFGNKVVINHNNGMRTIYAHLSSINVSTGQTVAKGSKIGLMGSTGNSTGVHLHFELYVNGKLQNPMDYLNR